VRMMRMMSRTVLLALLVAMPLPAKTKPISVPFTTTLDGFVLLPASLGGGIPMHVILDTGAGIDVLAPSLIEKVRGKPAGQYTSFRMTGERQEIPLFVVPELSVGPVVVKDDLVGSLALLDKMHLDGIVSLNHFRQQAITFDFKSKTLIFETPKTLKERRVAGASSPLQLDDFRGIELDIFSRFLIANQPGQCEIDTGSPASTISTRYMAPLSIDKNAANVHKREAPTGFGGTELRYYTNVPQISLAAAPQIYISNPRVTFSDIIYDCVIGLDFWKDRTLTLDIADRQLIVSEPSVNY